MSEKYKAGGGVQLQERTENWQVPMLPDGSVAWYETSVVPTADDENKAKELRQGRLGATRNVHEG